MKLFDFLKKKKKEEKVSRKKVKKPEKKPAQKKEQVEKPKEVKEEIKVAPKRKAVRSEVYQILKSPQITEKATDLTKRNQYVFKIYPQANKPEIKKAIEDIYGVSVLNVKTIKVSPKRRKAGWRKGYKKAIVKIKEGQKIEVLPR